MVEMKLREQLLVEKCINTLVRDYRIRIENENINAEIDFKLDFLSFLSTNEPEEVKYGIQHIKKYEDEYKILAPMILEYQTYGLKGNLECKPIPDNCIEANEEEPITIAGQICNFFNKLWRK